MDAERARRAIDALRKPDASLASVPNTVRQSIAEVIEELLDDGLVGQILTALVEEPVEPLGILSRIERHLARIERRIEEPDTTEAFALLDLIDAEFQSDPTSTQCFDSRIVERVRLCVARRKG